MQLCGISCTSEQHARQRPSMHVDMMAVCRLGTMMLPYRHMQPLHSKQVVPNADLDCMRQYESVQQLMQALLHAGQMPELQVCYAHKSFTEIPEQQLAHGGVERRYPTPYSHCQLWGS